MSKDYPLYPELSEEGKQEAQELINQFKEKMKKVCEETLGQLYVDVACYIESDSWTNYRNQLLAGFQNYNNRKIQGQYDFAKIRRKIYEEYRDEIIKDLNQDLVQEIESLKQEIKALNERSRIMY